MELDAPSLAIESKVEREIVIGEIDERGGRGDDTS